MGKAEKNIHNKNNPGGNIMKKENSQAKTSEKNATNAKEIAKAFEVIAKAMEAGFDFENFSKLVSKSVPENDSDAVKPKKATRTKAFSTENVREIERMIKGGATTREICIRFEICPQTIKNYLVKHHKIRPGHVKTYMQKLHENNMKAKKHVSEADAKETVAEFAEEPVAEAESAKHVEEAIADPADTSEATDVNKESNKCYMLDCSIIQKRSNREKWDDLVKKLRNEGATIYVHSRKYLEQCQKNHWSFYGRSMAESILQSSEFTVVNTDLHIQWAAAMFEAKAIICNKTTAEYCEKSGIDYIMLDEYLADTEEDEPEAFMIDPEDAEASKWVKKLTIPVSINQNKHAILKIADVSDFAKKHYGEENVTVMVCDCNGKERKSPTGMMRIKKGDFVRIIGSITVILKFSDEQLKDNCYEVYYAKTASFKTASVKTA